MSEPRGRWKGVNGAVAVLLGAVAVLWVVWASRSGFEPALIGLAVLMWLWLLAGVLVAEWVVQRLRGGAPPALPLVGPLGGPTAGSLAVLVVAVLLLREGILGPALALDLDWYTSSIRVDVRSTHEVQATGPPGQAPALAGAYLRCRIECSEPGDVCRSTKKWLKCDEDTRERPADATAARAQVRISGIDEPLCYTPLYKYGRVEPRADVTLRVGGSKAAKTHTLVIDATIGQHMTGLASCHSFRERLGHRTAKVVAQRMRRVIRDE